MSKLKDESKTSLDNKKSKKNRAGTVKVVDIRRLANDTAQGLEDIKDLVGIRDVLLGSTYIEVGQHTGVSVSVDAGLIVTSSDLLKNAILAIGNEVLSVKDEFDYKGLISAYTGRVGVLTLQQRIIAQPITLPLFNYGQKETSLIPYLTPTYYQVGGHWRKGYVYASCMPTRLPRVTLAFVGGHKCLVVKRCNVTVYEKA